uniref:WD repeat domain 36 n=1 Tax=Fundulus heteroclitus TaxID=8078 RepID=A0A3Q2P0E8_FUNHE
QSDWDGIVACHRGRLTATTWNYQRCTMGAHHLKPPAVRKDAVATAVEITSCGNFAVIGSSCGRVDVYNLQSGLHRGCYGDDDKLFSGFRVLGLYSNHVPHALRYHLKHREFYVVTSVGRSFHTFNNTLEDDITSLAADRMLVFAASGKLICAFARNKEVVMRYHGHEQEVRLLLPLGDQLVSADSGGDVIVWDVKEIYLRLNFDPGTFDVSAMMHPSTYLNKVLLGSSQGALQLWNIKTSKLLFTFPGWSAAVTVLQQSPAVDVVGVGTATGRIVIHNIRLDETLMSFTQDWGPISTLAFRTGPPILASGSPQGHIAFWDLERRQLVAQQRHAHTTAVAAATFLHGEPLLVTNGADNAIKVWIFDQEGGGARLLRCRRGHSAPPSTIQHHGNDGKNILSAQDGTLQSFSTVHERFNKNLGHHSGVVRGVATDTLNQLTLTCGSDWLLKFWRFKTRKPEEVLKLSAAPADMKLHRDGMLATALDDFTLAVVDIETRRVVRKFAGHHGNITGMTFSPDGRWLITTGMDCTVRTWDLPSGLVDCFLVAMAPVGVSMSPTGDFLATAHVDSLGVYLVTLSLMPESRWKSLLHLDTIKDRPLRLLKDCGPSGVSVELTCLTSEGGGANNLLLAFIHMIDRMLASGRDFDLAHAYLALFLKLHLRALSKDAVAMEALLRLSSRLESGWAELQASFNQSLCLLSYTKSALL